MDQVAISELGVMDQAAISEEQEKIEHFREDLTAFRSERNALIPLLQLAQRRLSYLPRIVIQMIADHLNTSPSEVYGVATFYNQFRFNPPGKYPIKVCMGTACHVKGGDIILENFERKIGIKDGQTTEDREFSIESVACVGCCALAPVVLIGEEVKGHMAPSKVEGMLDGIQIQKEIMARRLTSTESEDTHDR
jgi:NADH-quinone oxidoreductase subunit E